MAVETTEYIYILFYFDSENDTILTEYANQKERDAKKGWESVVCRDKERMGRDIMRMLENYGLKGWKLRKTYNYITEKIDKDLKILGKMIKKGNI